MLHNKVPLYILLMITVSAMWSCSGVLDPGHDKLSTPVAVTARINSYRQIVLVDYNNPTVYKQITFNDHQNIDPKFSHDRSKLVFQDKNSGLPHDPAIILYHQNTDLITNLYLDVYPYPPLVGDFVVWDLSDDVVFMRQHIEFASSRTNIGKYDLTTSVWSRLDETYDFEFRYPISMYDPSHLIITSDDSTLHEWVRRSI